MNTENDWMNATGFETKISLLWWQKEGLSYTASGYGRKIPTRWMIKFENRWYRIHCAIWRKSGKLFIRRKGREFSIIELNNEREVCNYGKP